MNGHYINNNKEEIDLIFSNNGYRKAENACEECMYVKDYEGGVIKVDYSYMCFFWWSEKKEAIISIGDFISAPLEAIIRMEHALNVC